MVTQTFVNLPVKDLQRSVDFFTKLGFSFNPQFTDENATCLILNETSFVMLLVEPFFQTFTPKRIADAAQTSEVLVAIALESREAVDQMTDTALANGGSSIRETQDHGWMYSRPFQDPDGHVWEPMWADISQFPTE
jgi:hypothetical protein